MLCSGDLVLIVVFFQVTLPLFKEWEDDNDFLACLCLKAFGLVGSDAVKLLGTGLVICVARDTFQSPDLQKEVLSTIEMH